VSHDHAACVAGKALRRFRRDAGAVDNRLTERIRIGQYRRVDVNDDLISLSGRAGIQTLVERRLRDQCERVGLLLAECRRVVVDEEAGAPSRGNVGRTRRSSGNVCAAPLMQRIPCRC
jgi:hypothetical protein